MPSASDTPTPVRPGAATDQRQEPVLSPSPHSSASPLPASIAGAFAAAAYSLQHSLQHETPHAEPPEGKDAGMLPQLYANRLRPRSRDFYLTQFKRFDTLDRSLPSWNMAAAFFTLSWCSLNGLWREAGKYLAAVLAGALIWWFGMRPALPPAIALGLGGALWLVALAVPGLLGNGWYWRKIKAQTLQAITESPNMASAHAMLQAQAKAPYYKTAATLVLALPVAAAAGAGLALLPASAPSQSPNTPAATAPAPQKSTATSPGLTAPASPQPPAAHSTAESSSTAAAISSQDLINADAQSLPLNSSSKTASDSAEKASKAAAPPKAPAPNDSALATKRAVQSASPASSARKEEPAKAAPQSTPKAALHTNSSSSDLQPGKFYLNVGVYSDAANASKVLAQLQKSKLPALSQKMSSNKGEVTRVRSGPFDSRKRAEKAVRTLQASQIEASIFQSTDSASKP